MALFKSSIPLWFCPSHVHDNLFSFTFCLSFVFRLSVHVYSTLIGVAGPPYSTAAVEGKGALHAESTKCRSNNTKVWCKKTVLRFSLRSVDLDSAVLWSHHGTVMHEIMLKPRASLDTSTEHLSGFIFDWVPEDHPNVHNPFATLGGNFMRKSFPWETYSFLFPVELGILWLGLLPWHFSTSDPHWNSKVLRQPQTMGKRGRGKTFVLTSLKFSDRVSLKQALGAAVNYTDMQPVWQ